MLTGGANTERNVSMSSGQAVAHALRSLGYAIALIDSAEPLTDARIAPAARFTAGRAALAARPVGPAADGPPSADEIAGLRAGQEHATLASGILPVLRHAGVVFITVFGDEGESGATQAELDRHGLAYTGPPAAACALSFDKAATKALVSVAGVPTPAWHVVRRGHVRADLRRLQIAPPWIVKPVAGGSTIGLSLVDAPEGLPAAVALATANGCDALIEQFVPGRDVTIGVLGDQVFAVVDIITDRTLYDYTAKYEPGATSKVAPARLTAAQTREVQALTRQVHDLLGLGDSSSRSDFRLDPDGRFWFFETNSLPGLTPTSGYPISAAAAGLDFPHLCHELVRRAMPASPA